MKANIIRQDIATTFIITLSLLVLFCLNVSDERILAISHIQTPIRILINNILSYAPTFVGYIVLCLTILMCCWKVTRIVVNYSALSVHNYTPAVIFVIFSGIYIDPSTLNIFIASYFILCFLEQTLKTLSNFGDVGQILTAYAFLGLAIAFYPPNITYALVWPITIILTTRTWRYWVASLSGLLTPIAIYYYICHFFLDIPILLIYNKNIELFSGSVFNSDILVRLIDFTKIDNIALSAFSIITITLIITAFINSYKNRGHMRRQQYNTFILSNALLILSIIAFLFGHQGARTLNPMAIPLAIIIPNYFSYGNNRFSNILYILLLLASILLVTLR